MCILITYSLLIYFFGHHESTWVFNHEEFCHPVGAAISWTSPAPPRVIRFGPRLNDILASYRLVIFTQWSTFEWPAASLVIERHIFEVYEGNVTLRYVQVFNVQPQSPLLISLAVLEPDYAVACKLLGLQLILLYSPYFCTTLFLRRKY